MTLQQDIAVVVPAHNAAATLETCLSAILVAGFAPETVIVVSDRSTDTTPAIAKAAGVRLVKLKSPEAGAASARNCGVAVCTAPLILFVDADVALHSGTRTKVVDFFRGHRDHAGVIGSYDDFPPAPGGLSRIRNLLHHHTHQNAPGDVPSFWTGCGAIRRSDFEATGGFEPGHPLEDVALGLALARRGRKIRLAPAIQCTHLKQWTLRSMIRADLFYRALPWSRMLLSPENADTSMVLNAGPKGQASVVLSGVAALSLAGLIIAPALATIISLTALLGMASVNREFLTLVSRKLGLATAFQAVAVLWVHFLCAGSGYVWARAERVSSQLYIKR